MTFFGTVDEAPNDECVCKEGVTEVRKDDDDDDDDVGDDECELVLALEKASICGQ